VAGIWATIEGGGKSADARVVAAAIRARGLGKLFAARNGVVVVGDGPRRKWRLKEGANQSGFVVRVLLDNQPIILVSHGSS